MIWKTPRQPISAGHFQPTYPLTSHSPGISGACVLLSSWDSVGKKGDRGPALLKLTFQRGRQNDVIAGEVDLILSYNGVKEY